VERGAPEWRSNELGTAPTMSARRSLNSSQFWKQNVNQMALPGFEEESHPGAPLLAEGYTFEHRESELPHSSLYTLEAYSPEGDSAGFMEWGHRRDDSGHHSALGRIQMVSTHRGYQHEGVATALYGMGRRFARIKPQHDTRRTWEGDRWARSTTEKFGGRVPKRNTLRDWVE